MKTRSHPTPLSIKILVACWSLTGFVQLVALGRFGSGGVTLASIVIAMAAPIGFIAYKAFSLWRLSWWSVVVQAIVFALTLLNRQRTGFDWRAHYPMLGPFVFLIPVTLYFALILPHWRKMNWALFGRPYRPPEDQVEVFA
jgi:hypothetical protein